MVKSAEDWIELKIALVSKGQVWEDEEELPNLLMLKKWLKNCATSIPFLFVVGTIVTVFFVWLSFERKDWSWFSRSGSIICILGATMTLRRLIRLGLRRFYKHETEIDAGYFQQSEDEKRENEELFLDIRATNLGFAITMAGTLVWAFGDLINKL